MWPNITAFPVAYHTVGASFEADGLESYFQIKSWKSHRCDNIGVLESGCNSHAYNRLVHTVGKDWAQVDVRSLGWTKGFRRCNVKNDQHDDDSNDDEEEEKKEEEEEEEVT